MIMHASLNYRGRAFDALHQVTLDLINRHDVQDILDSLLASIGKLLDSPTVSIDLLEGEDVIVTYAATPGQPLVVGDRMRRGEGGFLSWQAIDTQLPAVLDDYSSWTQRRDLYEGFPIRAILIVPIVQRGKAIGSLNFLRFEPGQVFGSMEIEIATRLAETVSLVLDNAQLYSQLQAEIDERKKAEAHLRSSQAQLLEKERALAAMEERERLARDLHDGVGQTLGFIRMQSDSARQLMEQNNSPEAAVALTRLTEAAGEANRDVRDYILGLKRTDLEGNNADFFAALAQYCQHIRNAYDFRIVLHLPPLRPDVLASAAVETHLTYIIREALHNARKHSGVQTAKVTVTVDGSHVTAIVEDEGHGMGGTYSGPERRRGAHFGLGIMRSRAEEVGGEIRIETSEKGTKITAHLPRKLAEENLSQMRVLVADDHPLFRDGLIKLLAGRGLNVVGVAGDGEEALAQTRVLKPDLLLIDINMPRLNGLEATRRLKEELPELKIFILTASAEESSLFEALRAGAAGYLLKGMEADELMTLVGEISLGEASMSAEKAVQMLQTFERPEVLPSQAESGKAIESLSDRQLDVLRLVSQGLTYKEAGQRLFLTERTIKFHMGEILKRLHLKGRREVVALARREGIN